MQPRIRSNGSRLTGCASRLAHQPPEHFLLNRLWFLAVTPVCPQLQTAKDGKGDWRSETCPRPSNHTHPESHFAALLLINSGKAWDRKAAYDNMCWDQDPDQGMGGNPESANPRTTARNPELSSPSPKNTSYMNPEGKYKF